MKSSWINRLEKVTGATQNSTSAVHCIRYVLASVCSMEKLSEHDCPLKSDSEMRAHSSLDGCFSSYVWRQAATHPRDVRH